MPRSLVARMSVLCGAILVLCSALLFVANRYAMNSIRDQAIQMRMDTLAVYAGQLEGSLNSMRVDMAQYAANNPELIAMELFNPRDTRYLLNMQTVRQWLAQRNATQDLADTHFFYAKNSATLLSESLSITGERHLYVKDNLDEILQYAGPRGTDNWECMYTRGYLQRDASGWVLLKVTEVSEGAAIGAMVTASRILAPLQSTGDQESSLALLYGRDSLLLTPEYLPGGFDADAVGAVPHMGSKLIRNVQTGERYLAIGYDLQQAPVRFVMLLPEAEIYRPLAPFRAVGIYIPCALMTILIAVVALLIRRSLQQPFQALIGAMQRVSQGDLDTRLTQGKTAEFAWLNAHFNEMVARIGQLNRSVSVQAERAHRAEIRHLQAQINPHFYQNILGLIYNLAALGEMELIKRTSLYLGDYFRFIMRSGDELIHLEDEMAHIANYMELQKIRYPGAVEYRADVPANLSRYRILPLIIQPFVENSMIHGFTKERLFRVEVRVRRGEGERVAVEIEDNGAGMDRATLGRLNRIAGGRDAQAEKHIGVWNVAARLRHFYGPAAKLELVERGESGGILVRMELLHPLPSGGDARGSGSGRVQ